MARPRRPIPQLAAAALVVAASAVFWFGLVPQSWSPFPRLDLATPSQWFVDVRLASLRRDRGACAAIFRSPVATTKPLVDFAGKDGCGWTNAVAVSSAGGAALSAPQLTCEAAAALALWVEHEVQPLAAQHFGSRVTHIATMGTYACRNIIGRRFLGNVRSQHATANAIDIAGFRLASGGTIGIKRDWNGEAAKARFLRDAHRGACRYFRVALSPEFNEAHRDHFHFDRGPLWRCK
ncbi:MAG: extensin family protein [Hyphomicrobiaceae bacterium]